MLSLVRANKGNKIGIGKTNFELSIARLPEAIKQKNAEYRIMSSGGVYE